MPSNPNSCPASSSDWVSTTQIVGVPPPARMSVTTSFMDQVPRTLITTLSYLESYAMNHGVRPTLRVILRVILHMLASVQ